VATVFEYQNYTKSREDAVADVLKAGVMIVSFHNILGNFLQWLLDTNERFG
jgi:hypothetical protein